MKRLLLVLIPLACLANDLNLTMREGNIVRYGACVLALDYEAGTWDDLSKEDHIAVNYGATVSDATATESGSLYVNTDALLFGAAGAASFDAMQGDATFACWFKTDNNTANWQILFEVWSTTTDRFELNYQGAGGNGLWLYDDINNDGATRLASGVTLSNGEWVHVVLTISGTTWTMYVNGEFEISQDFGKDMSDVGGTRRVSAGGYWGGSAYTKNMIGSMDEHMIWNVALLADQIRALYRSNLARHR